MSERQTRGSTKGNPREDMLGAQAAGQQDAQGLRSWCNAPLGLTKPKSPRGLPHLGFAALNRNVLRNQASGATKPILRGAKKKVNTFSNLNFSQLFSDPEAPENPGFFSSPPPLPLQLNTPKPCSA